MASENQLRHIVTLTDLASYRQAAEALGLTHSALSQTVSRMEGRYGVKLFERVGRRTVPTAYGAVLVEAARQSLEAMSAANHEIELMQSVESGRLCIGADPAISQAMLGTALTLAGRAHPGFTFVVKTVSWRQRNQALLDHEVDIWLGPDEQEDHPDLAFDRHPFPYPVALCRANHPALERHQAGLSLKEMAAYRIIGMDLPKSFHAPFEPVAKALNALDLSPGETKNQYVVAQDPHLILSLLFMEEVIALVPATLGSYFVRDGELAILPVKELKSSSKRLPACVAWRKERSPSPAAEVLRGTITEAFKGLNAGGADPWGDVFPRPSRVAASGRQGS
jgi:DNA-binding transcriptional LysR family regulator